MDKILELNNCQFDLITDMVIKQNKEKKEQFATILCKTIIDPDGYECLIAEDFQIWSEENLEQTEVSVSPISWDWVNYNILTKNGARNYHISTIVSLHTHPEWFGSNRSLDSDDRETFKKWTQAYRNAGIDMINGIVSSNGSLKLYRYNSLTDTFDNVICQVENKFVQSTLPTNLNNRAR